MPRNLAAALAAAALFFASLPLTMAAAAQNASPAQKPAPGPGATGAKRPPMPKPTNLKVLPRNIPVPELLATMKGFTKALGVECQFCHTRNPQTNKPDYASDANPDKSIARIMIGMTREINTRYMSQVKDPDATPADKTVTCGTCHRGNSMPMPFAAAGAMGEHHEEPVAPTPESKPDQKPR